MSIEELSAIMLNKMKQMAEEFIGEPIPYAVIAVPAHFNDHQRYATLDAGRMAGFTVLRIINEPTGF